MKTILLIFITLYFTSLTFGYSTTRRIGDVMQIAIPVTAVSTTYYMNDKQGTKDFFKSYFATAATTYLLKITTHRLRPDGSNHMSFPSGHTSSAFAGASFIHFRYGFKYSIPLYFLASFTGYSRVHAKKHYVGDVIAGAGLAIFNSWYFTSQYSKNYSINFYYNSTNKTIGINVARFNI